jgi:hypothetical protein
MLTVKGEGSAEWNQEQFLSLRRSKHMMCVEKAPNYRGQSRERRALWLALLRAETE